MSREGIPFLEVSLHCEGIDIRPEMRISVSVPIPAGSLIEPGCPYPVGR